MSVTTNQLVNEVKKMARKPLSVGAGVLLTGALAVSLVFHESSMRAAGVNATPIDDNSVAALTALDRAMEAVAAHVEPAVVNVQVTSKGSEEETAQEGQQQQLPPGFAQFFGPNGPFGGAFGQFQPFNFRDLRQRHRAADGVAEKGAGVNGLAG